MREEQWPIPVFDSLRGIASLAVAVSHFAQQQIAFCNVGIFGRWLPQLGAWGVTVFFVLSGFCIHGAYLQDRKIKPGARYNWMGYLRRRFLRIYPGMFVALVLSAIVGLFWTTGLIRNPNWRGFFGHLFLFSNFDTENCYGINAVLWSTIVECYFYLLYPVVVFGMSRFGCKRTLLTVTALSWGYFLFVTVNTPAGDLRLMWQMTFPALWWKWCLGVGLAELHFADSQSPTRSLLSRPLALFIVLLTSFGACLFNDVHVTANLLRFLLPIVVAVGVHGLSTARIQWLETSLCRWIGRVSYSIYLFHPIVLVGFSVISLGSWWWDLPLFLFVAIAAGAAGYYLVEAPAMSSMAAKRIAAQPMKACP